MNSTNRERSNIRDVWENKSVYELAKLFEQIGEAKKAIQREEWFFGREDSPS